MKQTSSGALVVEEKSIASEHSICFSENTIHVDIKIVTIMTQDILQTTKLIPAIILIFIISQGNLIQVRTLQ